MTLRAPGPRASFVQAVKNGPYIPFTIVVVLVLVLASVQLVVHRSRKAVVIEVGSPSMSEVSSTST